MPLPEGPEGSYASYDPTTVRPSPLGPPELSDSPQDLDTEPHDATDVSGVQAQEASQPLPEFDPRYRDPFKGLLFIGALTRTFTWLGHEFTIRNLTTEEVLAVALITAKYEGTLAENRAYVTAVVALATEMVDGEHLPYPYKRDESSNAYAEGRFNYVKNNWFTYTIDAVYEEYLVLENTVRKVLAEMGNSSG